MDMKRMAVIRVACALLLLFGVQSQTLADDTNPLTSVLVVARAELRDRNFKDSVVLVMNNIGPFPAGIIVNRPTRIRVSSLFTDLDRLAKLEDKVYFGGPVEIESVSFIFRADAPPEGAIRVLDGVYASTDKDLLLKLLARDKPMEGLRIYIGHTGWGPGQLEAEIARGDWKLAPADASAIFNENSDHPWPEQEAPDAGQRT
jgi:putative transcriptional regulator